MTTKLIAKTPRHPGFAGTASVLGQGIGPGKNYQRQSFTNKSCQQCKAALLLSIDLNGPAASAAWFGSHQADSAFFGMEVSHAEDAAARRLNCTSERLGKNSHPVRLSHSTHLQASRGEIMKPIRRWEWHFLGMMTTSD